MRTNRRSTPHQPGRIRALADLAGLGRLGLPALLIACLVTWLSPTAALAQQQPNFDACGTSLYLAQLRDLIRFDTSANPFVFTTLGRAAFSYNGVAFRPLDNYLYGIKDSTRTLIRIGSDGSTVDVGSISGLAPVGDFGYNAGEIAPDGTYYVKLAGVNDLLYRVNLATLTAVLVRMNREIAIADLAWYNGLLYGVTSDSARPAVPGNLYSINPANGVTTNIGNTGAAGPFGALFGTTNGVYGSSNAGGFYQFDNATGRATLIAGSPSSTGNDGAKCVTTPVDYPADVSVTKTDDTALYTPGRPVSYTIVVSNAGPFGAAGVLVNNPLPAGSVSATWTCGLGTGGGNCAVESGSGAIAGVPVNLPAGAAVTFTMTVDMPAGAAGPLVNTVTATNPVGTPDPNLGNNTATDTDNAVGLADLAVTKLSTPNPYVPGAAFSYAIVVTNAGPSNVVGATINDVMPAALAGFPWTCTGSGGAVCGAAGGTGPAISTTANLPAGSSVAINVSGTLGAATSGALLNTATVTPPPGVVDPVPGNNSDDDQNPAGPLADLAITKVSAPNPFVPGEPLTYTLVATNAGPSDVLAARIIDGLPSTLATFTWTCTPGTVGAACAASSGTGSVDVLVDIPAGGTITVTSTGLAPAGLAGTLTNTATIAPPSSIADPVPGNNSENDTNAAAPVADLSIAKSQTPDPYVAGASLAYSLVVSNAGPSAVEHARVQDVLPGVLSGVAWTCTAGSGASCGASAGVGVVDALVSLTPGSAVSFTITATVPLGVTGILTNTGTVAPPADVSDPNPGNNSATVNSLAPQADLSIVKTAAPNPYVPGQALTYTIVVNNAGPSAVEFARIEDALPPAMAGFTWTCAASGGASCGTASGTSAVDILVTMPAGTSVTLIVTGVVPPAATGPQANTATVKPPPGITDPNPTNNTSTVTPDDAPQADLSVTKTSTPKPYVPGGPLTYTVVVSNAGPSAVVGAQVRDRAPLALDNITWSCVATNAVCAAGHGLGSIDTVVDLEPGGVVTFTMVGVVSATATEALVNAAVVVPPANVVDPVPQNNSAVDFDPISPLAGPADLQITQEFPGVAPPAGRLVFKLVSTNLGANAALDPYITGMIPPGTTFVSAAPSAGGTCQPAGNPPPPDPITGRPLPGPAAAPLRCTWPGLMQVGDTHYVEFVVQVAPGTPVGQILWSCFFTWSETEDPYHANNVVDAYLFVQDSATPAADLAVQAAARSEGRIGAELGVALGSVVEVRFWATNLGPARSRGHYALILDRPGTIEVLDVSAPQGLVLPSGPNSALWDTGAVDAGQSVALDLTVRLRTTGAVRLFAQRVAGLPGDPNAANERATIVLDGHGPDSSGRFVAVGNLDDTSGGEILTGTGRGELPQVRAFTGIGGDTGVRFFAYEQAFLGGVQVASCDVDFDGIAEIITAPGAGRPATIRVLRASGSTITELVAFDAFEAGFLGGASVACADLDGDGAGEIVVGAGPGRAPEVRVYGAGPSSAGLRASFLAYEPGFRGGVRVAAGHYPGRAGWLGAFDIAVTPGGGRPAELRLFDVAGTPMAQAVVSQAIGGVRPTLGDANGDGALDLIVAPDDGRPELVRLFDVDTGALIGDVPGGLPGFPVGVRLATGTLQGGPGVSEIVVGNGPGALPRIRVVLWPPTGPIQRLEFFALELP